MSLANYNGSDTTNAEVNLEILIMSLYFGNH